MDIIIAHKGQVWEYIEKMVAHTKKYCPTSTVHYLGDEEWDKSEGAKKFAEIYVHKSSNDYNFELLCFQRWFVINEYVKRNNIKNFVCLDTDILVYCDLADEQKIFNAYDFTLSGRESPHISFWNNGNTLPDFIEFVEMVYDYSGMIFSKEIFAHYDNLKKNGLPGGVCDMTLLNKFVDRRAYVCADTSKIVCNYTFDHNLTNTKDWQEDNGLKRLEWIGGTPYGFYTGGERSKISVQMKCLHCSGEAKKKIPEFSYK